MNSITKTALTFFIIICVTTNCISKITYSSAVEHKLDNLFLKNHSDSQPGITALVSKNGKIIYHKQFGLANLEYGQKINKNSKFSIGSITKQFTSAAILMLIEQGKLNESDMIGKLLADYPMSKYPVTIKHLLTHTSGIVDYPRVKAVRNAIKENLTPQEILEIIKGEPLTFRPGEQSGYSNSGYLILGLIIEKISGQTYASFLNENIFKPLNMKGTSVSHYTDIINNRADGYSTDENDQVINASYHSSSFAAGAIISTTEDLNKWVTALNNYKVISKQSLAKMYANNKLDNGDQTNLGFGWEQNNIVGIDTLEHSGFVPGYKANSLYVPSEKLYLVVLQNSESGSPTPPMLYAAAQLLGKSYPQVSDSQRLSTKQLEKFVGSYEFEGDRKRVISNKNGQLFYKAVGGLDKPIYIKDENTLFFEHGYRQIAFSGKQVTYSNRNFILHGNKLSNQAPKENTEVAIESSLLESYTGQYKLEQFVMTITMEDGKLFAQPQGSDKLPVVAKSESQFFIKEIGAEIEFINDNNISSINIVLEGNLMTGNKI